jgi:hypothetical protein
MHWIEEPNKSFPKWPERVLLLDQTEALAPAWLVYWKQVLTDGGNLPRTSRFSLSIEVYARTFEADTGSTTAKFYNSLNRQADEIGVYVIRSDPHFTILQGNGEDDTVFERRRLVWLLEQYKQMKAALRSSEIWPLYEWISSSQPLSIRLATINGWFDLAPEKDGFGALPLEDQELLAGMEPRASDPMAHLTVGILSAPSTSAIEELTAALIQYTPSTFKNIHCTIKEGLEQGQRALFYQIECPEFPNDATTVVNDRVHRAATLLVQQLAPQPGSFAGVSVRLSMQSDGTWHSSVGSAGQ